MKSYLGLVKEYEKAHKRTNRITIACIVIAVCLVTAIFGMADMEAKAQKIRQINEGGYWHLGLKDFSPQLVENINRQFHSEIYASGCMIGTDQNQLWHWNKEKFYLTGGEEAIITQFGLEIQEGHYPQKENEILMDKLSAQEMGVSIGDILTFQTPEGDDVVLTVSGFCNNTARMLEEDMHAIVILPTLAAKYFDAASYRQVYYFRFDEKYNVRNLIDRIKADYALSDEGISENTVLLALSGQSRDDYMLKLYGVAFALFGLVLIAGFLMISGTFNTNVAERTQFFGMLRCLGATKSQIYRYVVLESLYLLKAALPLGLLLGIITYWSACAYLKYVNYAFFSTMPVFEFSVASILGGIGIGVFTVLLAALSPAKHASCVSPLSAVNENQYQQELKYRRHFCRFPLRIESTLGVYHATSNRKNLFLMTGSFAISIVLFLCFSVLVLFMNHAVTAMEAWTPDIEISPGNNGSVLEKSQIEKLEAIDGVKRAYGRNYAIGSMDFDNTTIETSFLTYEKYQFQWAKKYLVEGSVEAVAEGTNQVIVAYNFYHEYHVGDLLNVNIDGHSYQMTVGAIVSKTPFKTPENNALVIMSEKNFEQIQGISEYAVIDIQLKSTAREETVVAIRNMVAEANTFSDFRASNAQGKAINYSFSIFIYGFLTIITLITVFNIFNSMNMSITAHIKQYSVMHAVGMSIRQIKKMICMEAITYSALGCILGTVIGLLLHQKLFSMMITFRWGTQWNIPWSSMGFIVFIVIGSTALSIIEPTKKLYRI